MNPKMTAEQAQVIRWLLADLKDGELKLPIYDRGIVTTLEKAGLLSLSQDGTWIASVDKDACERAIEDYTKRLDRF